jgi:hypothetical protein
MYQQIIQWVLSCSLLLAGTTAVFAGPTSEQDIKAAQQVVKAQLDAFAADDNEKAFSYATDAIRERFGTATHFARMVRGSYPVVYRPDSLIFLQPEGVDDEDEDELVQPVHMTDTSGATWMAIYQLLRQPDNSWRIGGCILLPNAGKTA